MTFDLMTLLTIGAAGLAGIAAFAGVIAINNFFNQHAQVSSRLQTYLGDDSFQSTSTEADPNLAERLNERITQQRFAETISRNLQQADLKLTVPEYILLRIGIPIVLSGISVLIWQSLLAVPIAALFGVILPVFWMRGRQKARNRRFNDLLPETLTLLVGSLRSGLSFAQALRHAAKESPDPMRTEIERVLQELQLGIALSDALDHLVERMESADLDLIVTAIKINQRVGGNLSVILENISTTIRERNKLRRDVQVITSMQRISAYVVGFIPFAIAILIFLLNPRYMERLFDARIWFVPTCAVIMSISGFLIIRRMADIKV